MSSAATSSIKPESTTHRRPRRAAADHHEKPVNGRSAPKKSGKKKSLFCNCRGKDDGSPMICCGQCREWYHFNCIALSEQDAEDIDVYVCTPCQAQTGLRTVRDWEGPDAVEHVDEATLAAKAIELTSSRPVDEEHSEATPPPPPVAESEQDSDPSSDEYVVEGQIGRRAAKRRIHRVATPSEESDSSDEEGQKRPKRARLSRNPRRVHTSTSPAPVNLKRKQSGASQHQPAKKQKSGTNEDPTRKYCLGKLQELFCRIFLKYPYFPDESKPDQELDLDSHFTKSQEDLTEEEKASLEEKAKDYATQVEIVMFETHSEYDKAGKQSALGKYKERFRMLDFNLTKPDRVVLHKRIVSLSIPPEALSHMSSTDLASEEEKQSIKLAEQESLAHSILNKRAAPRAKITHKGLQDIEDIDGATAIQRDIDMDREQEEEDRRDRERMARLRLQQQQQQQATGSSSVPPESPITSENPTWGAPPPVPAHNSPVQRPGPTPLLVHTASDVALQIESELNLADLINIDEDSSDVLAAQPLSTPSLENPPSATGSDVKISPVSAPTSPSSPTSPRQTGISPFAVNTSTPDLTTRPSFDLSSVWSGPPKPEASEQPDAEPVPSPMPEEPKEPLLDMDFFGAEAEDKDFDMFLEQELDAGPVPESSKKEPVFANLPIVWNGMLHMPLDSTIPQDVPVLARQMGGRVFENTSPLWGTLFPTTTLRIDGRVPVDQSSQYLLQMRMNSTKELIAVAFAPKPEPESLAFKFLMDHLLGKQRHGLVFPWGKNAKEPGRELYIIPLLSSDPLPDYMELLDSLKLPKTRTENYLVGIWILNKGKLAPPAPKPTPVPQIPAVPRFNGIPHIPIPPSPITPQIPSIPNAVQPPPVHPSPAPVINSAALAAEVASLTPEQIQRMLQTLTAAGTSIPAILQQQLPPQHLPIPPPPAHATPPQPWLNSTPPHPNPHQFAPPFRHTPSQSPPQNYPFIPQGPPPPYPNYDGYDSGTPQRGSRGRGRGRGGPGRGNGRDNNSSPDRPRDSGWGKRGGRGSSYSGWEERPY